MTTCTGGECGQIRRVVLVGWMSRVVESARVTELVFKEAWKNAVAGLVQVAASAVAWHSSGQGCRIGVDSGHWWWDNFLK
jgi:hypothetical protein